MLSLVLVTLSFFGISRVRFVFLCDLPVIEKFNSHFSSYELPFSAVLHQANLKSLFDYHLLGIYKVGNVMFLPLIHAIDCIL